MNIDEGIRRAPTREALAGLKTTARKAYCSLRYFRPDCDGRVPPVGSPRLRPSSANGLTRLARIPHLTVTAIAIRSSCWKNRSSPGPRPATRAGMNVNIDLYSGTSLRLDPAGLLQTYRADPRNS